MGYIYLRTNKINGKQYVGQVITRRFKTRQSDWNNLKRPYAGIFLNRARAKYGIDAFDFEILKECEDEELDYWEMYYIKELNTKTPNGYNLTDGGDGMKGYHWSEESKRKISEKAKGRKHTEESRKKMSEVQNGENNGFYGKHHSEETKKKISEAHKGMTPWNKGKTNIYTEEVKQKMSEAAKGRHPSEEVRKKMSESNKGEKNGMYGKHHSEETKKKISEAHKGRHPSEEVRKKMSEQRRGVLNTKCSKPVIQIDKNTNEVIADFPSMAEVKRQLGFSKGCISCCCRGITKSAYGYIWKYKESAA